MAYYPIVLVLLVLLPWSYSQAEDGPSLPLRGKVSLPLDVQRNDLICELVEQVPQRIFSFDVTPIQLSDDLRFETRSKGMSGRSAIIVRTLDGKWKGSWVCQQHELLSKSSEDIVLEIGPVKLSPVQITYESQPQAGAILFVNDEFYVEPVKADENGLVWIDMRARHSRVLLAAIANGRLGSRPIYATLPDDGSQFQLALKQWEREPIQVVGTDGQPVANVALGYGGLGKEKFSGNAALQYLFVRSGSDGMTTPLLYSDYGFGFDIFTPNLRFVSFDRSTKPHRVVVAPTQPKIEFKGKLILPNEIRDGLLLSGHSFQSDSPNSVSTFQCRLERDGAFIANIHPEYTYSVLIKDEYWVSDPWSGILASDKPALAKELSLKIVPGEAVEVIATRGKDLAPARGIRIRFFQPHDFTWMEEGNKRQGQGGRRWGAYTDAEGVVTTRAAVGELEVSVYEDAWKAEVKVIIRPGEATVVNLHNVASDPIYFEGQIEFSEYDSSKIETVQVTVDVYGNGPFDPSSKLVVDGKGKFHGYAAKSRIALVARTNDRKHSGIKVIDLEIGNSKPLVVELHPSASIYGRLLDQDGFAITGANVNFYTRPVIPWPKKDSDSNFFQTESHQATTNEDGKYVLENVCSRVSSSMFVEDRNSGLSTSLLYNHSLEPVETILPTYVMSEPDVNARPIQMRIQNRVNSSRLLNTNMVFVYHGSDKSATDLARNLFAKGAFKATRDLSPLVISDSAMKGDQTNAAWLKKQGWGLSNDQEILLVLFDQTGKPITSKRVQASDNITTISEIIELEQLKIVPQSRDAQSRLKKALELAGRTDRDVWISFLSIHNPNAIALLRWQDKHRTELEKYFVMIQFDWVRDENIDAILERYNISRNQDKLFISVLANKDGELLEDTTGESQYKNLLPSQILDRDRIGAVMKAASHPIDASQLKSLLEAL